VIIELAIHRVVLKPGATIGVFAGPDLPSSFVLEDEVRVGPKVDGQTAIPPGRYRVVLTFSGRFQKKMPELLNVPGFTSIRLHGGNTAADTLGCPMLARYADAKEMKVWDCADIVNAVIALLQNAEKFGDQVWITVA
jgi:hypothetical protein